jgi:hypothetical protein
MVAAEGISIAITIKSRAQCVVPRYVANVKVEFGHVALMPQTVFGIAINILDSRQTAVNIKTRHIY